MKLKKVIKKIQQSIFLVSIFTFSLLFAPTAFADIAYPDDVADISRNYAYLENTSAETSILWGKLSFSIICFLVAGLIIELPIFIIFGFKTKKKLGLAVMANVISVPSYHIANALLSGSNVLVAELLIAIFECVFLVSLLKKEMSVKKIIIATVAANATSFILGAVLVRLF